MDTVCEKDKTCIIKDLDPNDDSVFSHIVQSKSPFGRGGMITKAHFAMRTASLGITVFIANGRTENVITDIILNDQNPGTKISSSKKTSPIKRWLAFSEGNEKGSIILNDGAVTAMTQKETPISILPIGINDIEGKFQKGDVVRIKDKDDNQLGVGVVHYDYQTAKDLMGKANQKPIIHYDHLWVDKI
jgi:glutamate 5-kinase